MEDWGEIKVIQIDSYDFWCLLQLITYLLHLSFLVFYLWYIS